MTVKITRRSFLKATVLLGGGAVLTINGNRYTITMAAGPVVYKLRILHTNDHHARIEPVALQIGTGPAPGNAAINREFGGVSRRKTLIDQIRAGAAVDENVMLLDAGDVFQGTLYFNQFNGLADLFFYNALGYEAVTIGNHEFDKGQAALRDFVQGAAFPVLSANVLIDNAAVLAAVKSATPLTGPGVIGPRTIITKGGKKIGIFGLTPPDTGILTQAGPGVTFDPDIVTIAQAQVNALKTEGADYIVGLTHVGYDRDLILAAQVRGINVIIGGHSHTPLLPVVNPPAPVGVATAGAYPTLVNDPDGNSVVICTDWEWAKWLGDMTVGFDAAGLVSVISGVIHPVWAGGLGATPRPLLPGEQPEIVPDATFEAKINTDYKPAIATLSNTKVGVAAVKLDGERANVRGRETNMGNLIADICLARTRTDGAVVALMNGGGIRASILAGDVTLGNVITVLPFGNTLSVVTVTGAQLLAALENGVSQVETGAGRFPQIAGMRFLYTRQRPVGQRVLSAEVNLPPPVGRAAAAFAPIDPAASYRLVTNNFLLGGGDGYASIGAGTNKVDTGYILADLLADKFITSSPVSAATEGRIIASFRYLFPWMIDNPAPVATLAPLG